MPALARAAEDLPGAGAVRAQQRPQQQVPSAPPGGREGRGGEARRRRGTQRPQGRLGLLRARSGRAAGLPRAACVWGANRGVSVVALERDFLSPSRKPPRRPPAPSRSSPVGWG